jgi:serine/threonine protein kinase
MALSEIEQRIVRSVVDRFLDLGQATQRYALVREFEDPAAIDRLYQWQLLRSQDASNYLPTTLSFHYCGSPQIEDLARCSVEAFARVFRNMYLADKIDLTPEHLKEEARKIKSDFNDEMFRLGLFLAPEFRLLSGFTGGNHQQVDITPTGINEEVVKIKNTDGLWDNYCRDRVPWPVQDSTGGILPRHPMFEVRDKQANQGSPSRGRKSKTVETFETAFDTYTVLRQVGAGGSGVVYEVKTADGEKLALKRLERSRTPHQKLKRFQNEIQFCQHPGSDRIVRVLDYGRTADGSLFYVMPFYPKTLRDLIRDRIPPEQILPLYGQILDCVEAAHLLGVCHRDIKPENVLYDPNANWIVLADFGIARFKEDELLTTVVTGPHDRLANFAYAAPEQRVVGKTVDARADLYALGLILNEMFTGQIPQGTGFHQIKNTAEDFGYLDGLVEWMVRQQPEDRPASIANIKGELIARGNDFVQRQRLDAMKQEVVPETELDDPLLTDPIHLVRKLDYRGGVLTLQLNRAVNPKWEQCFRMRANAFSVNVSAALMTFRADTAFIRVNDHFVPQAVEMLKQFCAAANEEYSSLVRREHQKQIEQRRAELRMRIATEEARSKVLGSFQI